MLDVNINLIEEKMMREHSPIGRSGMMTNGYRKLALGLLNDIPNCLKENVLEWLFDKPFSDINYKGMTYNQFIQMLKKSPNEKLRLYSFSFLFGQFVFFADNNQDKSLLEHNFPWIKEQ